MAQSGFLSLPPELRIRIYEYALDPLADPNLYALFISRRGHVNDGCCFASTRKSSRRCDCARNNIGSSLLRVNKQVFAEAMPVLCNLFELRVRIPFCYSNVGPKELGHLLDRLPDYAYSHMHQLLFVGAVTANENMWNNFDVKRLDRCDSITGIENYWKVVQHRLPKVRQIRVHIDLSTNELKNFKLTVWAFKGLVNLPSLKRVRLELHQKAYTDDPWTRKFMEEMQAALSTSSCNASKETLRSTSN